MPVWLIPLLLQFLPEIPQLIQEGENIFTGHDPAKVAAAIGGAAALVSHGTAHVMASLPPAQSATAEMQQITDQSAGESLEPDNRGLHVS